MSEEAVTDEAPHEEVTHEEVTTRNAAEDEDELGDTEEHVPLRREPSIEL